MTRRTPPPRAGYSTRSRLDKLGVEEHARVAVLGVDEPGFLDELRARTDAVAVGRAGGRRELVLLGVTRPAQLARLATLRRAIAPAGAIWVVWPKGRPALREDDVRAAARAHDLVDVKVMAFSHTLSALKLVIPLAKRAAERA